MPRKAQILKNSPVTIKVMESYFDDYFGAIKSDSDNIRSEMNDFRSEMNDFRSEMNTRFNKIEKIIGAILETMNIYDKDKKEIKLNLWEHDCRILKLEKQLVK